MPGLVNDFSRETLKRVQRLEGAVERLRVRERAPSYDPGTIIPHPLAVSGGWHTGLLPWGDLNKTGSSLADLVTRNYTDLQNREHNIVGADHTIAAAKWNLVGASADNTLGLLLARSIASGPVIYESVLKTDAIGGLEIVKLTATSEVVSPQHRATGALTLVNAGSNDIRIEPSRHMVLSYNRRFQSDGANLIGYLGNGFGIWTDSVLNKAIIETDNLTVRGRMSVYELVIRQIRSTNGNLLVSSSSKIKTVTGSGPYTITVEDNTYHGFFPGDLIKAQRWASEGDPATGAKSNVFLSEMTVLTTPTLTTYTAQLDNSSDPPEEGWDYVRHGNTSDPERQGMVGIMADDTNSPFIAIVNGVASWADWGSGAKIKGLIGNLNGSAIGLPPDANGYEYGIVFGDGWTHDKHYFKISTREALFNRIYARWYNGLVETVRIEPEGNLLLGKDVSANATTGMTFIASTGLLSLGRRDTPSITFNSNTGASYFTGIMTLANTAEIRQGVATAGNVQTDAFSSLTNYTGFRLWAINAFSGQVGILAGYNAGTAQWSASPNGHFLVGNITNVGATTATADVILHSRGVTLKATSGASSAADSLAGTSKGIRWYNDPVADTNPVASILGGADTGGFRFMTLNVRTSGGTVGSVGIYQLSGSAMALWLDNITELVGFPAFSATKNPGGGFDEAITFGTNGTSFQQYFGINDDVTTDVATNWLPRVSNTYNLGSAGLRWGTLHVQNIIADTITGGTALGGQVWQYDTGDMYIRSNNAADRTLFVANPHATGTMSLDVEGDIDLGGLVDGIDIAGFYTTYSGHIIDPNAHHNRQHAYDSTSDHTGTLSWSNVNKTGSSLADLATRAHSALTGIGANDHHNQVHAIDGSDHSASGLTSGHVMRATSASTFGFGTITSTVITDFTTAARAAISVSDTSSIDMTYNSGTGVISGVVLPAGVDHNSLANLTTGDPHTQYVHISNARSISASHTFTSAQNFNMSSATAPFVLNANAQSQLVVGLRADQLNKSILPGNGLSGGGLMTADRTLTVVGNTLISVGGSGVSIADAPGNYYMIVSGASVTPAWQTIANLAGNGLTATNGSLDVVAGDSTLTVAANSVVVNTAHNFVWSGTHQFTNTVQVQNNLYTYHVLPALTDTYDIGSPTALYRQSFISQMNALIFAENTIQLIGGWFMVPKYAGKLPAVASGDVVIDLGVASGGIIAPNDFILIRSYDTGGTIKAEYIQVGTNAGGTTWNVTRDVAGTHVTDPSWADGTPFVLLGTTGDGRIELNAADTPRISLITQGATYNAQVEVVRIGDLNASFGYVSQTWGITIGRYGVASNTWLSFDLTNGIRIGNNATVIGQWATNGNVSIGDTNNEHILATPTILQFKNGGTVNASLDGNKWVLGQVVNSRSRIELSAAGGIDLIYQDGAGVSTPMISLSASGNATFVGDITAASGTIGGWTINAANIAATNITIYSGAANTARIEVGTGSTLGGINSANANSSTLATGVVFWAGDTHANRNTASFRVYTTGRLVATNVDITGDITATSGSFSGTITSSSGTIGGFTIGANLSSTGIRLIPGALGTARVEVGTGTNTLTAGFVSPTITGDIVFWAGQTFANMGTAPLIITQGGDFYGSNGTFSNIVSAVQYRASASNSPSSPMYSFTGDADTGMYRSAANTIAWSTNGSLAMSLNASNALTVVGALDIGGAFTGVTSITMAGTLSGVTTLTATTVLSGSGGVSASAGGSPASYTPYRFNNTHGTGLLGSPGLYVGLAVDDQWHLLTRADGGSDSYLRIGYGIITTDRNAYVDFHANATAGTSYSARIIRAAGVNGSTTIANTGTGNIVFQTNGSTAGYWDASNNLNVGATLVSGDGSAAAPAWRFSSDPNTGIWSSAADTLSFSTGGTNRASLTTTAFNINIAFRAGDGGVSAPGLAFNSDTDTGFYRNATGTIRIASDGTDIGAFVVNGTNAGQFGIACADNGASNGAFLSIARNTNASTPAGGHIRFVDRGGTTYYFWVDDAGTVRINTANPTSANDLAGTVVGQQTSMLAAKDLIGRPDSPEDIMKYIGIGAKAVWKFAYKAIASDSETIAATRPFALDDFSGIIVDYAPRYGIDKSPENPYGNSLNVVNAIGDLMIGTDYLHRRIQELEEEVALLKQKLN